MGAAAPAVTSLGHGPRHGHETRRSGPVSSSPTPQGPRARALCAACGPRKRGPYRPPRTQRLRAQAQARRAAPPARRQPVPTSQPPAGANEGGRLPARPPLAARGGGLGPVQGTGPLGAPPPPACPAFLRTSPHAEAGGPGHPVSETRARDAATWADAAPCSARGRPRPASPHGLRPSGKHMRPAPRPPGRNQGNGTG